MVGREHRVRVRGLVGELGSVSSYNDVRPPDTSPQHT